jgi:hypothetical protein
MANLRLAVIKPIDSTTIKARFTEDLSPLINTSNVVITSNAPGVEDPEVLKVIIDGKIISILCQPLTPFASYFVTFATTDSADFKSLNGQSFLFEDGTTNSLLILGPEDPDDPVRKFLINFLKDSVYNLDTGTLVRKIINSQSDYLSTALHDIRQVKNENYLQVNIFDEPKTRGAGPFERLNEEGAYQILRVGRRLTDTTLPGSISFASFPSTPITLQAVTINSETLEAGTGASTFDGLQLTVDRRFVTKLNSVVVTYADLSTATYDISRFGYQINNPRYDQFASTLLTLEDNQFKLSDQAIEEGFVAPVPGDTVVVSYDFKNGGRFIDTESVAVSQVLDAVREVTPAIVNEFTLSNAPIVDVNDNVATFNGVTFLDPAANPPFSAAPAAFAKEIPFRVEGLPRNPGEFSIDYENARVFVYGASTNDGTGNFPPTATYKYRKSFRVDLDYTYDSDFVEVVASPLRDLAGQQAKISFDFEETLQPEIDFKAQIHQEILDERVDNRVNSTNSLSVLNTPITNVFRIFNETTGEIYNLSRFNDSRVYFTATNPPSIQDVERERSVFTDVFNETLLLNTEFTNVLGTRVFQILLSSNNIMSATEDVIGSSYNTSVTFSRGDLFGTELYFDGQVISETANTDRLTVGRYQIDYENGIIFVGVSAGQGADLGTVNYKQPVISPVNPHLISVSEIYHSISNLIGVSKRVALSSFADGAISPAAFDLSDERFLNNNPTLSYTLLGGTITVQDDIKNVRNVYDAYDLTNNEVLTNFAEGVTVSANIITLDPAGVLKQEFSTVSTGLVVSMPLVSPAAGIVSVTSVTRVSDNVELFDAGASFTGFDITLSGVGSPVIGQEVLVTYRVGLTGAATPVVDYNRGDHYVDYTYLADEILVSYEYGDNVLDFRESNALDQGDEYFVSYKVGALRDSLLRNFGSLVDIPILNTFDTSLPRENYRDALQGALQSFTKGPTIPSMKSLVKNISHIEPEIIEAAFQVWSLGISHLFPNEICYTGDIQLLSAKYDAGALITNPDETITFPVSSNLKIEDGTLEMWVVPEWDGLDNDATLTFQIFKDGYILEASKVFIGASSFNPTYDMDSKFTVSRFDDPTTIGLPSKVFTDTGVFIYYDDEAKVWNVLARDSLAITTKYTGTITSSGEVYNVKFIETLGEINDVLRSGLSSIEFEFNLDGYDVLFPDGYAPGGPDVPIITIPFASRNSICFNGIDENVHCGDAGPLQIGKTGTEPITWQCWAKTSASVEQGILGKRQNTGLGNGISFVLTASGAVELRIAQSTLTDKQVTTTTTGFNDDAWHHFAFTFDGVNAAGMIIYVDGSPVATSTDSDDVINNYDVRTDFTIGSSRYTDVYFDGCIDDVAIYDKALSAAEITTIYNGGNPPDLEEIGPVSNMIGYWLMGDNFVSPDVIPNEVRPNARPWPTVRDFSTSGFDGIAEGDSTPPVGISADVPGDPIDTSIQYNAGPSRINMGDVTGFEHTDAFSVVGWVRQNAAGLYGVIHKDPLGFTHGWTVHLNGAQQVNFRFIDNLSNQIDRRSSTSAGTVWRHFVATYDGSGLNTGINLYHNGSLDNGILGASDVMAGSIQNTENLEIGSAAAGGTNLSGNVAHIAIYDKELTASEAATVYNSGTQPDLTVTGPTANLVGYWKLGDDIGGGHLQNAGSGNIFTDTPDDGLSGPTIDGYIGGTPGDGYVAGFSFDGICFMADEEHYLFDFGKTETTNRFSLFKDGRGYLNFRVHDRGDSIIQRKSELKVSADISDWLAGQKHHVGIAWNLNSSDRADEMHLFVDGFEVPNILQYGGRPQAASTDRFRTVKPEVVIGSVLLPAITSNDLNTVAGSATVTSDSIDFGAAGIVPGHTINILETGFGVFTILGVAGNALVLSAVMPATLPDARFSVNEFSTIVSTQIDLFTNIAVSVIDGTTSVETEIPGLRADVPAYSITKNALNENILTILGGVNTGDSVVLRSLGKNHRRARARHFTWGNTSSVIKTQLAPPINLNEVSVVPVIFPLEPIGPDNSTLSGGQFIATGLPATTQPSNATEGRTLSVRLTGSNVDFTTPVSVTINGTTSTGPLFETLSFFSAETQNTTLRFFTVTSVDADPTPLVDTRDSVAIEIKEEHSITVADGNTTYPVIRFSYKVQTGFTLEGTVGSDTVTDDSGFFSASDVGNLLVINSPGPVAGSYTITSKIDNTSVTVDPVLPATFAAGSYNIFNVSIGRSGFQNGWFTFEEVGATSTPFLLKEGIYEFDYSAYLEVPLDPVSNLTAFVGSDMNGNKQAGAVIDEFRTLSRSLTDVRVGESLGANEESITTDFTSLNPFTANSDTLMLIHFDSLPLTNDADFWVTADKEFLQSGSSVNDNFGQSLVIFDKPLVRDNAGILSTISEGTIEFWVSPRFDTFNDPNLRFYFDAGAGVLEETVSITNGTVQVQGSASRIESVRLQTDLDNSGIDYFAGGEIEEDFKTIKLGIALPAQRTPVKVNYIPSGLSGDRISIYKDREGYITFNVKASGFDYQIRQPVFWSRDTWHRISATYKFNRTDNQDEIRLFVDGEERGTIRFGQGLLFGQGVVFGQGFAGVDNSVLITDINFNDTVNQIFIGSDFLRANPAQARIDNLRLSNVSRRPTTVSGQDRDIVYSSNLDIVFPVIEDAFTTFLLDFDKLRFKTDDLAILRDEQFGIFNFTLNVIDSFDIVLRNAKIQQVLEDLVLALKPAQSKATINYIV